MCNLLRVKRMTKLTPGYQAEKSPGASDHIALPGKHSLGPSMGPASCHNPSCTPRFPFTVLPRNQGGGVSIWWFVSSPWRLVGIDSCCWSSATSEYLRRPLIRVLSHSSTDGSCAPSPYRTRAGTRGAGGRSEASVVAQSLSCVWLYATLLRTVAYQASLSFTIFWNRLKLMSIELVMPSNHLILCHLLLLLPSIFPSIRVFSSESALPIRWPKYWSFSFSMSPSNEYSGLISFRIHWFDLLAVQGTLKSLLQHHSSKASILRCSAFFIVQLSHPHTTTAKTVAK